MLLAASGLIGRPVYAREGRIGALEDLLIDDRRWRMRWLVVGAGEASPGGEILIAPSAVAPIRLPPRPAFPMFSFAETLALEVDPSLRQIESAPILRAGEPVTADVERRLCAHYGWETTERAPGAGDDLRAASAASLKGFAVDAADGEVGTVDALILDDVGWRACALIVATPGWFSGKLVEIPLDEGVAVDWAARRVRLGVPRKRVLATPAWDPLALVDAFARGRVTRP